MSQGTWLPRCIICKESVSLTESKADEHGRAVHENCYYWTVILNKPPRRVARPEPVTERLSLITMLMSAGWN